MLTANEAAYLQKDTFLRAELVYISYYALHTRLPDGVMSLAGQLQAKGVLAIVTAAGSPLSHSAILARSLHLPMVTGAANVLQRINDGDVLSVVQAPLSAGSVCVIGNEANGLTAETIDACTHRLTIPMAGRAESLNAAVAAGIMMYELTRTLP